MRVEFAALYIIPFPLHVHKNFKHYYTHGNHLVIKYVFNDVGIGPLVLEYKIHQQRLCTLYVNKDSRDMTSFYQFISDFLFQR